jgi:hypothetical protein
MTIYSKWDMLTGIKDLQAALKGKGLIDPEVTVSMSTKDWRSNCIDITYKLRADSSYTYKSFYGDEAGVMEPIFTEAQLYVTELKSKEELEHEEFMAMLGRVMDRAKDLGMDADFINPLTSMMKKLASNAIEHKR